ncbi:MAG: helix-turn-helix domain-containing protein [Pseudarcicella sp.]|nr:helix-turn-helix domain-containing protein [Pseudarcicella sp.]
MFRNIYWSLVFSFRLSLRVGLIACFVVFASTKSTLGQIKIELERIPQDTPPNAKIYISGTFNNWKSDDESYLLKKDPISGRYFVLMSDTFQRFEYKFSRGNWQLAEGNSNGKARENRIFDAKFSKKHILDRVESWEDFSNYTFVVRSIPENTPHDAQLYIVGNFNDWDPCAKPYKLVKQSDGTYRFSLYSDLEKIEFKFTRGNWNSVEGRDNGKALANRVLFRKNKNQHQVECKIVSWEDLSYKLSFYDLFLLFSAFQGVLLILALSTLQNNNRLANKLLVALILVSMTALFSRISSDYRAIFQSFPKLILLPELILFLYAPLFYYYVLELLTVQIKTTPKWVHFLPFLLVLLLYLPYLVMEHDQFINRILDRELSVIFAGVSVFALLMNAYYWFVCRRIIAKYKKQYSHLHSSEQSLLYLNAVIWVKGLILLVWIFACVMSISGKVLEVDNQSFVEKSTDAIWLVFSIVPYFMGYFAMNQPQIFRIKQKDVFFSPIEIIKNEGAEEFITQSSTTEEVDAQESESIKLEIIDENLLNLKRNVEKYMYQEKPYINSQLTLNQLAEKMAMNPVILSKVINEGFQKNFFDFVNTFRIEEFKNIIIQPKYKNYTLLAVAFEVGFNSKSAFNRSFKKITNTTPSDFYNELQQSVD